MDHGTPREFGVITVRDILGSALPANSHVVAGSAGLHREVTWALRLRPAPPAFGHISGGEIVILPQDILGHIDDSLTLSGAIRQLAAFNVAVIATTGEIDPAAVAAADAAALPIVVLPETADLATLEHTAARSIAERRRSLQAAGQDVGSTLMEIAIAGEGIDELASTLSSLAGRSVVIDAHDGRSSAIVPVGKESAMDVQSALADSQRAVIGWLRTMASSSAAEPPVHGWPLASGGARLTAPVCGRHGLLGSVTVIIPPNAERPEDTIYASRAAAAAAVALAHEATSASVRREVELNVLDELLDGALRSEVSLAQQANRLGHQLDQTFVAFVARIDSAQDGPSRSRDGRQDALDEGMRAYAKRIGEPALLWRVRNGAAEVIVPVDSTSSHTGIADQIQSTLGAALDQARLPGVVSVGIGRPAHGIVGIRQSHQEARQALTLGRRLFGSGHTTRYDDLGIFRLILAAESLPEMRDFLDENLRALISYDELHGTDLVRTLEAFFSSNCSPKESAAQLGVHRNTVLYRLERIADVTGFDLDNPDVRLRLHLALHVRLATGA